MSHKPHVYVVNDSGHDFSAARKYGELIFLTEGYVPWDRVNHFYRQAARTLAYSRPEDWLLMTGPNSIREAAAGIMARLHGQINILVWDINGFYRDYSIHVDNLLEESTKE